MFSYSLNAVFHSVCLSHCLPEGHTVLWRMCWSLYDRSCHRSQVPSHIVLYYMGDVISAKHITCWYVSLMIELIGNLGGELLSRLPTKQNHQQEATEGFCGWSADNCERYYYWDTHTHKASCAQSSRRTVSVSLNKNRKSKLSLHNERKTTTAGAVLLKVVLIRQHTHTQQEKPVLRGTVKTNKNCQCCLITTQQVCMCNLADCAMREEWCLCKVTGESSDIFIPVFVSPREQRG